MRTLAHYLTTIGIIMGTAAMLIVIVRLGLYEARQVMQSTPVRDGEDGEQTVE